MLTMQFVNSDVNLTKTINSIPGDGRQNIIGQEKNPAMQKTCLIPHGTQIS